MVKLLKLLSIINLSFYIILLIITKIFLDLYLVKFLDISTKLFFFCVYICEITKYVFVLFIIL